MPENPTVNEHPANMTNESMSPPNPTATQSPLLEKIRALRHRLPLAVRLPLAIIFLLIGIISGFIPILQGWMFVLTAFWLIFPDQAEQLIEKIKAKFDRFKKKTKS